MKKKVFSTLTAVAVGAIAGAGLLVNPLVAAADHHDKEHKEGEKSCGAGKCSAEKKGDAKCSAEKKADHSCSADKKADHSCSADKKAEGHH